LFEFPTQPAIHELAKLVDPRLKRAHRA
jgi:hypothetical protein